MGDCCVFGDQNPLIAFDAGSLTIVASIITRNGRQTLRAPAQLNIQEWSTITYRVVAGVATLTSTGNTTFLVSGYAGPRSAYTIQSLYLGDKWYNPAAAVVRNVVFNTTNPDLWSLPPSGQPTSQPSMWPTVHTSRPTHKSKYCNITLALFALPLFLCTECAKNCTLRWPCGHVEIIQAHKNFHRKSNFVQYNRREC